MGKKNSTIAGVAILTLAIAGCASENTPQATTPTPTAASPSPNAALVNKSPRAIQSFNNPVVAAKNVSQVASATPNLIQSTNATERAIVVSKGRNDPFAQITGQTVIEVANNTTKPVPDLPPLPIAKTASTGVKVPIRSAVISARLNTRTLPSLTPVLPRVLPPVVPSPNLVSVLPQSPQPELAKAVIVSGVVLLGNQLQAIIKVPNEPASRYVQAGQRLANGVLIKRIEMNEGSNPVVIVEQYGIEVARMVGDAPTATAAGNNPVPGTTPPQNPVNTGAS
ncbi:hypothetical protein [Calothrix sp. PCC 7507]|uniref:hypothetical protein n=1 Tax=Calothrix sp. PCC 7507 TaxID=99598 RepID=UPI00029EF43C|nr:hypothetical protein [Calothrix sp. PCC 7507]AFY32148.1 hypothetical protein Cal7507_1691 [Calothrix sp. PCC 7507]